MKQKPKSTKDLQGHESDSENLLNFLRKYWVGLDDVKPIGYSEFCESYCDFDGMEAWQDNERGKQEDEFNGFDNGSDGVNFVSTVSLPHIAYDDTCQGRPPIQMLISACISYGFARGHLFGKEDGVRISRYEMRDIIERLLRTL